VSKTEANGRQSGTARCSNSRRKRRGSGGMREGINRDGGAGEMRSLMISRASALMGHRLSLEVTMMGIGGIDIPTAIGVVSGAEADQESTDESDHAENLERRAPDSIRFSYDSHDHMKSIVPLDMKLCTCRPTVLHDIGSGHAQRGLPLSV
jgi:hypothetical protein